MIAVLSGGTGGAKFVDGLRRVLVPQELTVIVNTGDDHKWWGLYVSPDIDSITYVLAGLLSRERGWGVGGDTFHCLQAMKKLGEPAWFTVGDRDLATHLVRTKLLSEGQSLSSATSYIAGKLGVRSRILPMSDMRVETRIDTPAGNFSFEEYFVGRGHKDAVNRVYFVGASEADPAPGVFEAITAASVVLIAPSNPVTSIGPILAVRGIREALRTTRAPVVAVSPIIGNAAFSGPAATLMSAQQLEVSIAGIAEAYSDFLRTLIADESDSLAARLLNRDHLQVRCTNIAMTTHEDKTRVARAVLALACPEILVSSPAECAP
jgi:LPPG:FO 2-phospho-L-lactate transferase